MANNEIRTRTVYFLTKRVPDENYDVYVGSTSLRLTERLQKQKSKAKHEKFGKSKVFKRMIEVGLENWMIVPLLTLDCTKEEIRSFERKWCELLEADLNTYSPFVSKEETREGYKAYSASYRAANREKILERKRAYNAANREKINEKQRAYNAANREKINEKQRAYNAANREKINEKQRAYRAAKKEKILRGKEG